MKVLGAVLLEDKAKVLSVDDEGNFLEDGEDVGRWRWSYVGRLLQRGVTAFEHHFYKVARASELLTYWNVQPECEGGRVARLLTSREVTPNVWSEDELEDWQYELAGLDSSNLGFVEPHPEGSDRGGYVPTLTNGCHYDEGGNCWQG